MKTGTAILAGVGALAVAGGGVAFAMLKGGKSAPAPAYYAPPSPPATQGTQHVQAPPAQVAPPKSSGGGGLDVNGLLMGMLNVAPSVIGMFGK